MSSLKKGFVSHFNFSFLESFLVKIKPNGQGTGSGSVSSFIDYLTGEDIEGKSHPHWSKN
jgi:hypothetical protein